MQWPDFVEQHGPLVYRTAWRILGHAQDCEDVVQEVFTEAHGRLVRGTVDSWPALLHQMTTHRSIDALRRRRGQDSLQQHDPASQSPSPDQEAIVSETRRRLLGWVADLPDRQAVVFTLVHFDDLSVTQAADVLRTSENAVSVALHKARKAIRQRFDSESQRDEAYTRRCKE